MGQPQQNCQIRCFGPGWEWTAQSRQTLPVGCRIDGFARRFVVPHLLTTENHQPEEMGNRSTGVRGEDRRIRTVILIAERRNLQGKSRTGVYGKGQITPA